MRAHHSIHVSIFLRSVFIPFFLFSSVLTSIFSLKFEGRIFDTRIHRSINILNSRAQIRRYNFLSEHRAGETKTLRGLDVVEKYVNKVIARGNTFGARNMEIRAGSWNLRRHNSIKAAASNSCRTNWRAARPGYLSIHRVESINPGAVAMRPFRNSFRLLPGRMNKRTCAPTNLQIFIRSSSVSSTNRIKIVRRNKFILRASSYPYRFEYPLCVIQHAEERGIRWNPA